MRGDTFLRLPLASAKRKRKRPWNAKVLEIAFLFTSVCGNHAITIRFANGTSILANKSVISTRSGLIRFDSIAVGGTPLQLHQGLGRGSSN